MEKGAKSTLRQLKEACLRSLDSETTDQHDEVVTMVTASTLGLQCLMREEVNSLGSYSNRDSLCALLETNVLEGLQEVITQELRSDQQTPPSTHILDSFWSDCLYSVKLLSGHIQLSPLNNFVSSLCRFSFGTSRLLGAFLSVGKAVLDEPQLLTFLSGLHNSFWSQETKRLAAEVKVQTADTSVDNGNSKDDLIKLMATAHCFLSIYNTVLTSLKEEGSEKRCGSAHRSQVIDLWLCRSTLITLLASLTTLAPKVLWCAYQGVSELDKEAIHTRAGMAEIPEHLQV